MFQMNRVATLKGESLQEVPRGSAWSYSLSLRTPSAPALPSGRSVQLLLWGLAVSYRTESGDPSGTQGAGCPGRGNAQSCRGSDPVSWRKGHCQPALWDRRLPQSIRAGPGARRLSCVAWPPLSVLPEELSSFCQKQAWLPCCPGCLPTTPGLIRVTALYVTAW